MKRILLTLILGLTIAVANATDKKIVAEVIIENSTGRESISGKFYINETNESFEVNSFESFKITVPKKGKYKFRFTSDDFVVITSYPKRITKTKNTIIIHLMSKTLPENLNENFTDEQIEEKILDGNVNFISHGIYYLIPEEYLVFKKKYGVGLKKESCVMNPISMKIARDNNQRILKYFTDKYGGDWLASLDIKPFGTK